MWFSPGLAETSPDSGRGGGSPGSGAVWSPDTNEDEAKYSDDDAGGQTAGVYSEEEEVPSPPPKEVPPPKNAKNDPKEGATTIELCQISSPRAKLTDQFLLCEQTESSPELCDAATYLSDDEDG